MKVTIYSRPGCHLCEEAVAEAERLRGPAGFGLEVVDIEKDDELHRRYLEAIPVISIDGKEALRLDGYRRGGLQRAVESARGAG